MTNPTSSNTADAPKQRASRSALIQLIDRVPDWVVILLFVLLALVLLGAIMAFA
jgi:type VI protein secretion system component VasF